MDNSKKNEIITSASAGRYRSSKVEKIVIPKIEMTRGWKTYHSTTIAFNNNCNYVCMSNSRNSFIQRLICNIILY